MIVNLSVRDKESDFLLICKIFLILVEGNVKPIFLNRLNTFQRIAIIVADYSETV